MIKIIKMDEIDLSRTIYSKRCNSCRGTRHVNILSIMADGSNSRTIIALCDDCLKELQKQIGEGESKLEEKEIVEVTKAFNVEAFETYYSDLKSGVFYIREILTI